MTFKELSFKILLEVNPCFWMFSMIKLQIYGGKASLNCSIGHSLMGYGSLEMSQLLFVMENAQIKTQLKLTKLTKDP
jgi:hypothetical protein